MDSLAFLTDRIDRERASGDVALCDSAVDSCEGLIKHCAALLVASIPSDPGRAERYLLEHRLIRSSGVGEWGRAIQMCAVGHLNPLVQPQLEEVDASLADLSQSVRSGDWRHTAVCALDEALEIVGVDVQRKKIRLLDFFTDFAKLRNKLDAHGAPDAATKARIGTALEPAARSVAENLMALQLPLVSVRKDAATGAPIVAGLSLMVEPIHMDLVRQHLEHEAFRPGAYVVASGVVGHAVLMSPAQDLRDLAYANGGYREIDCSAEYLSYSTGITSRVDVADWSLSPTSVRRSETAGLIELECRASTITNAPLVADGYVARPDIEELLVSSLSGERRDVVTLKGRGGIGKTTLALEAVRQLSLEGAFEMILWFSGRDLDLRESDAVRVHQDILSIADVDDLLAKLLPQCGLRPMTFEELMAAEDLGRLLCIFDNFETIDDPGEAFAALDAMLRRPHKLLITTRHRDSRGDFPIDVPGMTKDEFRLLVDDSSRRLSVPAGRIDVNELYRVSEGHPYVAKVLMSELRDSPVISMGPALASREDLLEALFERTVERLSADSLHAFLLLCSWKSDVPEVGLDIAVNGVSSDDAIDVRAAVEELVASSLIEVSGSYDELWIHVPFPAWTFGKRKLRSYPRELDVRMQREMLMLLGPVGMLEGEGDLAGAIESFWRNASQHVGLESWDEWRPRVERLATADPTLWTRLGRAYEQVGDDMAAGVAFRHRVEHDNDESTWLYLARLYERRDDDAAALNAWVRRAACDRASVADASHAANKVNSWLARERVEVSPGEPRRLLVEPLITVLEEKCAALSGQDFSRLAWLYVHAGDTGSGINTARRGLERTPGEPHCQSFLDRFS